MTYTVAGKIEKGKIIPEKSLPLKDGVAFIKIFVYPVSKKRGRYFGTMKGIFGDGLEFQRKIRSEWN